MTRRGYYRSDFLFPEMNFIIGCGSVMNIVGNYYNFNTSKNETEADAKALASDWGTVGIDLNNAIDEYRKLDDGK